MFSLYDNKINLFTYLLRPTPQTHTHTHTQIHIHKHTYIPRCYKDVYVNSFFPRTAKLWNSLPVECFPLTYDLSGFKPRINSRFNCLI